MISDGTRSWWEVKYVMAVELSEWISLPPFQMSMKAETTMDSAFRSVISKLTPQDALILLPSYSLIDNRGLLPIRITNCRE